MSDYLVVFQLPENFFASIDDMHAFEQKMMNSWPKTCQHDGHDIGNGSINFFVFTAFPQAAFLAFRKYLGTNKVEKKLRVAYRLRDGVEYTNIWPKRDVRPFALIYE
jgi:hypothetical protein